MALWTFETLVKAADGIADGRPSAPITGFSIDTRSIQSGEVFVALTDTRDGHDFVSAAFKAGAVTALVRHDYARKAGDGALIRVDDPLRALERIGIAARARLSPEARVIAVTGSAGKTGTKEMLRACLSPLGPTHAPEKSFNNHWGVPLTLARMPAETCYAVIEIGMNHAGEITPLTRMARPHIAIITNVLPVHIGNFPDGEIGVAKAKAEIFEGLEKAPDGRRAVAVYLRDGRDAEVVLYVASIELKQRTFGAIGGASIQALSIEATTTGSRIAVRAPEISYEVGAPGRHIAVNSLAVVAVLAELIEAGVLRRPVMPPNSGLDGSAAASTNSVIPAQAGTQASRQSPDGRLGPRLRGDDGGESGALDADYAGNGRVREAKRDAQRIPVSLEDALKPLATIAAPAGRGARSIHTFASGGQILLIDESYNANPASMRAALANLALVPRDAHPRRIAVLGDMRELGEQSTALHLDLIAPVIASGADLVFACGPQMKGLFDQFPPATRGAWAETSTALASALAATLRAGDVVMIKGSLGTNMAPLVAAVRSLDAGGGSAKA